MSQEDDSPITIYTQGWEELPDGRWQLLVECPNLVHYVTLPKSLVIGDEEIFKQGWDSDRRLAFYHSGSVAQTLTTTE